MQLYHDKDADLKVLDGKKVAVLGYGSQGRAQALCFNDSGIDVTIGVRKDGKSWNKAKEDGLKVAEFADAVKDADVVMMLLPDEVQPDIYKEYVEPNLKKGAALEFAHGFAITYKLIQPPADVDVIMMAPKAPGDMERLVFTEGFGVPALICIHQDVTGNAKKIALALAKGLGSTRAGVFETTFDNETYTDLFGEQSVLCGGLTALIRQGFKTLTDAGYPPEMAYFEVLHETKLIDDLIIKGGFELMWNVVSTRQPQEDGRGREEAAARDHRKGDPPALREEELKPYRPGGEMSRMIVRTRNGDFPGDLDGSDISNAIWLSLPLSMDINMLGGMIYCECPLYAIQPKEGRTTQLEVGDIAYWPGPGAFCIFYGPTPLSGEDGKPVAPYPVIKIGRMVGDCSGLEAAGDRQKLTLVPPY